MPISRKRSEIVKERPVTRIAILDDYQNVALEMGDWKALPEGCEVVAFTDHLSGEDEIAQRLADFEVVVVNRERTPFGRGLLEKLPKLGLLVTSGLRNASIDVAAARKELVGPH
jgi:lactate dehydrogenase-like 2-hydroxyacid dehydrogenase